MAGEAALIILDTVEALMPAKEIDIIRATLPKALEVLLHLLACNESVSIMEHLFATQRSILVKVTFQNIFVMVYRLLSPPFCDFQLCIYIYCAVVHDNYIV